MGKLLGGGGGGGWGGTESEGTKRKLNQNSAEEGERNQILGKEREGRLLWSKGNIREDGFSLKDSDICGGWKKKTASKGEK